MKFLNVVIVVVNVVVFDRRQKKVASFMIKNKYCFLVNKKCWYLKV